MRRWRCSLCGSIGELDHAGFYRTDDPRLQEIAPVWHQPCLDADVTERGTWRTYGWCEEVVATPTSTIAALVLLAVIVGAAAVLVAFAIL